PRRAPEGRGTTPRPPLSPARKNVFFAGPPFRRPSGARAQRALAIPGLAKPRPGLPSIAPPGLRSRRHKSGQSTPRSRGSAVGAGASPFTCPRAFQALQRGPGLLRQPRFRLAAAEGAPIGLRFVPADPLHDFPHAPHSHMLRSVEPVGGPLPELPDPPAGLP